MTDISKILRVTYTQVCVYTRMERSPVIRKSYRWPKFAPDRRTNAATAFADGGDFKRGAIN